MSILRIKHLECEEMVEKINKPGNPGHSHANYVPITLCAESRAHIETKIDNMENTIKSTIKVSMAVGGFILAILQLVIHFWG